MVKKLDNKEDAISYFSRFFEIIKTETCQRFGNNNDDQLSYRSLAIRDALNSLPCPIFGEFSIDHIGEFSLENIQSQSELIRIFDLNEELIEDIKTLRLIYYENIERWLWYWLLSRTTLSDPAKYARDFLFFFEFTFQKNILEKFGKEIDYVRKYNLQSASVLPLSELLKMDKTVRTLFKPPSEDDGQEIIEDLQRAISGIQLSPKVPEGVKKVFNAAKKLYIFGYFEYYFFTISYHYTLLALESALRNRYNEIFGKPNGFVSLKHVITKLQENKIIRDAEKGFYDAAKDLRNSLSHLTRPSVFMPSAKTLENTAFMINQIYEENKYA